MGNLKAQNIDKFFNKLDKSSKDKVKASEKKARKFAAKKIIRKKVDRLKGVQLKSPSGVGKFRKTIGKAPKYKELKI